MTLTGEDLSTCVSMGTHNLKRLTDRIEALERQLTGTGSECPSAHCSATGLVGGIERLMVRVTALEARHDATPAPAAKSKPGPNGEPWGMHIFDTCLRVRNAADVLLFDVNHAGRPYHVDQVAGHAINCVNRCHEAGIVDVDMLPEVLARAKEIIIGGPCCKARTDFWELCCKLGDSAPGRDMGTDEV
jgi:hypothetical protein